MPYSTPYPSKPRPKTYLDCLADFRNNHKQNFHKIAEFEAFEPAYRFGYELAQDPEFEGRAWDDVLPAIRDRWLQDQGENWDVFRFAIRYGWALGHHL